MCKDAHRFYKNNGFSDCINVVFVAVVFVVVLLMQGFLELLKCQNVLYEIPKESNRGMQFCASF